MRTERTNYFFAFVDGNGTANDKFTLDANGTLRTAVVFDYEAFEGNATLFVRAEARDEHNATLVKSGYIHIHNDDQEDTDNDGFTEAEELAAGTNPDDNASIPNRAPTNILLATNFVLENRPVGTVVGTLSAVDPDDANGTGNYLFAFVDGNGTANDKFTLDANGTLRTAVIFDYESFEGNASLLIRAGTRDDHNATFVRNGYVFVHNQVEDLDGDGIEDHADPDDDNDGFSDAEELAYGSDPWNPASVANQFPTAIDLNVATVAENQPVGTILGDFNASDPDANATHVFTLVDGNGSQHNNFFTIDANGTLRTAAILDYETNATRSIRVRAIRRAQRQPREDLRRQHDRCERAPRDHWEPFGYHLQPHARRQVDNHRCEWSES